MNFHQDFVSRLVDMSNDPLFHTYQTVLVSGLVRRLYEERDILVHFQPGARYIDHFMPPFIVTEEQIGIVIAGLYESLSIALDRAVVGFVAGNLKQVF